MDGVSCRAAHLWTLGVVQSSVADATYRRPQSHRTAGKWVCPSARVVLLCGFIDELYVSVLSHRSGSSPDRRRDRSELVNVISTSLGRVGEALSTLVDSHSLRIVSLLLRILLHLHNQSQNLLSPAP